MADTYTALSSISHSKGGKQIDLSPGDTFSASQFDKAELEDLIERGYVAEGGTVPVAEQPTPETPVPSGRAEAEAAQAAKAEEDAAKKRR